MSKVGSELRKVRKLRDRSLRTVAGAAKISVAYLQKLESGDVASPSPHVLHRLSRALEVPYFQLMQAAGYVVPAPAREGDSPASLLAHALSSDRLTPDEIEAIAKYLAWYRHEHGAKGG